MPICKDENVQIHKHKTQIQKKKKNNGYVRIKTIKNTLEKQNLNSNGKRRRRR